MALFLFDKNTISTELAKQLRKAKRLNDKYNLIRSRVLELFNYRNRIAHGAILEDEIDAINLLDFETFVKRQLEIHVSDN